MMGKSSSSAAIVIAWLLKCGLSLIVLALLMYLLTQWQPGINRWIERMTN